ncbi:MAG TPA: YiiX/YebB-like N1pC/P60 family cysteine hydrolase [Enterobacteriaceae bacterium]|nr:YiiX/YebB-like N1pC/P60 family cysteine hydrolase [Enterobacteriaceae bacterium]
MKHQTGRRGSTLNLDNSVPIMLTESGLQVADVLFCRSDDLLINYGSAGQYTHAAIYLGGGLVAEATTEGVKESCLADFIARYTYVAVTRADGMSQEPEMQSAILTWCQKHIDACTPYDYLGAGLSPTLELIELSRSRNKTLPPKTSAQVERKRTFCSQFVADAFIAGGFFVVGQPNSAARSPTALAEDNNFQLKGYLIASGDLNLVKDDLLWGGDA